MFYLGDIYNVHLLLGKGQPDWLVPIELIAWNPQREEAWKIEDLSEKIIISKNENLP